MKRVREAITAFDIAFDALAAERHTFEAYHLPALANLSVEAKDPHAMAWRGTQIMKVAAERRNALEYTNIVAAAQSFTQVNDTYLGN